MDDECNVHLTEVILDREARVSSSNMDERKNKEIKILLRENNSSLCLRKTSHGMKMYFQINFSLDQDHKR